MSSQYGRIIGAACVCTFLSCRCARHVFLCTWAILSVTTVKRAQSKNTTEGSASQQRNQTLADTRCCAQLTATGFFTSSSSLLGGNSIVFIWIAKTFSTDIHDPQRMNPSDFGDPLTFVLHTHKRKLIGLKIDPAHVDGLVSLCWCRSWIIMIDVVPGPSLQLTNQTECCSWRVRKFTFQAS